MILALVAPLVCAGIVLATMVSHASWTICGASLSASVACAVGTLFLAVATLVLIYIRVIIVMSSVTIVVKIASLKVDGGKTLLESSGTLTYSHFG